MCFLKLWCLWLQIMRENLNLLYLETAWIHRNNFLCVSAFSFFSFNVILSYLIYLLHLVIVSIFLAAFVSQNLDIEIFSWFLCQSVLTCVSAERQQVTWFTETVSVSLNFMDCSKFFSTPSSASLCCIITYFLQWDYMITCKSIWSWSKHFWSEMWIWQSEDTQKHLFTSCLYLLMKRDLKWLETVSRTPQSVYLVCQSSCCMLVHNSSYIQIVYMWTVQFIVLIQSTASMQKKTITLHRKNTR